MKGWDYSQTRNGDYRLRESTRIPPGSVARPQENNFNKSLHQ